MVDIQQIPWECHVKTPQTHSTVTKYILIDVQRVEMKDASFSPAAALSSLKTPAMVTQPGIIV